MAIEKSRTYTALRPLPLNPVQIAAKPAAKSTTVVRLHPPEPTNAEMAVNFAVAMTEWGAAGFPVVTREQYGARKACCDRCMFWDGKARLGLGKCKAPGCGCTSFKRWLATETCKHPEGSRWLDIRPAKASGGS